jgi:hypothetical protein
MGDEHAVAASTDVDSVLSLSVSGRFPPQYGSTIGSCSICVFNDLGKAYIGKKN